jgi:hypothetical protein
MIEVASRPPRRLARSGEAVIEGLVPYVRRRDRGITLARTETVFS